MSLSRSLGRAPIRTPLRATQLSSLLLAASVGGASPQSTQLEQELIRLGSYYAFPASRIRDRRRERFARLAQQWRKDTLWQSSTTEMALHPAYQAIIGMGQDVLPWILEDLSRNSGHWFWALKAISNEDPVPPESRGSIKQMRTAWLRWGDQKGIIVE